MFDKYDTKEKALLAVGVAVAIGGLYFLLRPSSAHAATPGFQIPDKQAPPGGFRQVLEFDKARQQALVSKLQTGDIMLAGRQAYVLVPDEVQSDTRIFVILHGGFGSDTKVNDLGRAAVEGGISAFDVLTPAGAADQALALMGRKARNDGYLVAYLGAGDKKQWSVEDINYVRSAVDELRTRSGADGRVNVTGAAAGLLISSTLTDLFKNERAA